MLFSRYDRQDIRIGSEDVSQIDVSPARDLSKRYLSVTTSDGFFNRQC